MTTQTLEQSLDTYLKSLNGTLSPAETPMVGALRLMAQTLDAQTADEGPVASLLSTYTRELARFQKARANMPARKTALGAALDGLADD